MEKTNYKSFISDVLNQKLPALAVFINTQDFATKLKQEEEKKLNKDSENTKKTSKKTKITKTELKALEEAKLELLAVKKSMYKEHLKQNDKIIKTLDELVAKFPKLPMYLVDAANEMDKELAYYMGVDNFPTLVFFKNGSFNRYKDQKFAKKDLLKFIGNPVLYGGEDKKKKVSPTSIVGIMPVESKLTTIEKAEWPDADPKENTTIAGKPAKKAKLKK